MLLFDIRKENIEQSRAIRTLVTDMADKLPASFQESLSPIMLAMSDAIERLKNEQLAALNNLEQVIPPKIKEVLSDLFSARLDTMTSALERFQQQTIQGTQDTFSELVASFKQTLTGTTDTQFSRLAEVLSTTSEVLHDLVDKFQQTQQVLDEQIGRVLQAVQSQTMTLTQGVVDKFMETVEHLKSLTQASSQTLAATADQAVAHVAEQGQQYLVNLEKVGKSLEDQVTRMMDVMHRQTGMVTDETSKALQEAVTQIRAISEASVQHVSQASESALDQLTQRGGEYFDQARGTLEHLVRRAAELAEALNRTSENILIGAEGVGTTIKQYETAIQSGTNLVQALQDISASMIAVSRDSRMVTENWTSVVAAQQEVTGRLNRVMEEMGKISRDSHGLMESAPKVFSGIHQEYRQIVEVVNNNIRDYTDTVKHGLENYLQQANTYFNDTVHQLGSAVMELSETLPELTEELQKALVILKKERRL
jgi:ABC-type transporter Mla subunit MlaD